VANYLQGCESVLLADCHRLALCSKIYSPTNWQTLIMSDTKLVSQAEDFNEWYNTVVLRADLADYGPSRGTMIVKPYGWTLWENIQAQLDRRFKATGHLNAGFPMFIPKSFLEREAHHVEGFAPELAVVTIGGGKELEEPLVVRPTSETIIGHAYAKWIKSYRDLPVLLNLWNSVVRWEMRTKLFLRTLEFWWQEGHTAHATHAEAEFETRQMLDVYADFAVREAAIPIIRGRKSNLEKFAGADVTYCIEAMMRDGKALQAGTSHNLGQNFAKAFDIQYLDHQNQLQHCWTTSWGMSTRMIGAIIMTHGDDRGLILPPRLAPYQVVIVPIYKNENERTAVWEVVTQLQQALGDAAVRVKVDDRAELTPGFKFNDWELRGVPLRLEIGPKDVQNNTVALARRDQVELGKAGKRFVSRVDLVATILETLTDIQTSLLARATAFRDSRIVPVNSIAEIGAVVDKGYWAQAWWAGDDAAELRVKQEFGATTRCFPFEQPGGTGTCIATQQPASEVVLFAKAY
jgi:prolyl-tRNA synthetase